MPRSRVGQIAGLHLQHHISLDRLRDLNLRNYTVLDEAVAVVPAIHAHIEDAVICLRLYRPHWKAVDPVQLAREADTLARTFLHPTDFVTPANEQNIEDGGGSYAEIAAWCAAFAQEWRRLGAYCGLVAPALAPGHGEDTADPAGMTGYQILQPAWASYDLIGVHGYWEPVGAVRDPAQARWNAFRQVDSYRRWWPDKDCWFGEFNAPHVEENPALHAAFAEDVRYFLAELARRPWVRAATYFVDDSLNQPYRLVRIPSLYALLRAIGHEQAEETPATPEPVVEVDRPRAESRVFIDWAAARWDAGQDHRDLAAFQAHLAALGLAASDPHRFGWPCAAVPPAPRLVFYDATHVDVGPLIERYAAANGVTVEALIALVHAESGWNPYAERWGERTAEATAALARGDMAELAQVVARIAADGTPEDISFGYPQFTMWTAQAAGLGDGTTTVSNLLAVRAQLFDRETGVRLAAEHLARCFRAMAAYPEVTGDERLIGALTVYNSGAYRSPADVAWWSRWQANVERYREALRLTRRVLANLGWPAGEA